MWWAILYFGSATGVVLVGFWEDLAVLLPDWWLLWLMMGGVLIVGSLGALGYGWARRVFVPPRELIWDNPALGLLTLDSRYLLSKTVEIFFQQVMIGLLVVWLHQAGGGLGMISTIGAVVFGLGHVYLIGLRGAVAGLWFVAASVIAGGVFPILILNIPAGLVYTFLIHLSAYIIVGIGCWIIGGRKSES